MVERGNKNPFRSGLEEARPPAPCAFVIFGASGDLARKKLVPALYNLAVSRLLPAGFAVVGFAGTPQSSEEFRRKMHDAVAEFSRRKPIDPALWNDFASRLEYVSGHVQDPSSMRRLRETLELVDRRHGTRGNRIYYLATPPSVFPTAVRSLAEAGLANRAAGPEHYTRIVIEKPFGRDLASAEALDRDLRGVFREEQIFRVDHYLGKETVQNVAAFRFGNEIFEPLWNRHHVDHVQITVAEEIGVDGRGKYYEEAGATRDIVQNHLLQLLTLTAMEPPVVFDADAVRDEKLKVLRAMTPIVGDDVLTRTVRGQYGPGMISGVPVPGYREEPDVAKDSSVETFVAMKLEIDNWRFGSVPVYIRTGKRLPKRVTEISIHFRRVPHALLRRDRPIERDILALRIQPDDGISLRFMVKEPGPAMMLRPVTMDFRYGSTFGADSPDAYERLLLDAMRGDATLFARADEVLAAWRFVTPILEAWAALPPPEFPNYAAGTWGPAAADEMITRDGRQWRRL